MFHQREKNLYLEFEMEKSNISRVAKVRENELFNTIGKLLNVEYIYDESSAQSTEKYMDNDGALEFDINMIDDELRLKMLDAISFADFDKLIELISEIENKNMVLAQQLKKHAYNYEYDYLQTILNIKN